MLCYPNKPLIENDALTEKMRQRRGIDQFIDRWFKEKLISENENEIENVKKALAGEGDNVFDDAKHQIHILRHMNGIVFARTEEELVQLTLSEETFPEGYQPCFLSADSLKKIPFERRLLMAQSLLLILRELEKEEIFPGIMDIQALVYDSGGTFHNLYLSHPADFQLGAFSQTWCRNDEADCFEDIKGQLNNPFFDETCQSVANARIIRQLIQNEAFTRILEKNAYASVSELDELLGDFLEKMANRQPPSVGIWILASDCENRMNAERYMQQAVLLNQLIEVNRVGSECRVFTNYVWCSRHHDRHSMTDAVCATGMRPFDRSWIPDIPYPLPDETESERTKDRHIPLAFAAAEYGIFHESFDKKLLLLLLPDQVDLSITWTLNQCGNPSFPAELFGLDGGSRSWMQTASISDGKKHIFNTDDRTELAELHEALRFFFIRDED